MKEMYRWFKMAEGLKILQFAEIAMCILLFEVAAQKIWWNRQDYLSQHEFSISQAYEDATKESTADFPEDTGVDKYALKVSHYDIENVGVNTYYFRNLHNLLRFKVYADTSKPNRWPYVETVADDGTTVYLSSDWKQTPMDFMVKPAMARIRLKQLTTLAKDVSFLGTNI